jgi:CRP-like cAMP-binding protein
MALRENHFYLMDPVDFYKLVRLGTLTEVKKGDLLVGQGENNRYVRMLLEGELKVLRDGKLNYILEKANFVSESGLHAGLLLPGSVESCCSVVADTPARVLVWDRTQLMELLEHDAGVRKSLQAAISWDVVRKLKGQRSLISSGLIDDPEEWTKRRTEQTQHRYSAILSTLLQYPSLLKERRRQLDKYRMIHHIDDNMHKAALASYGWTPEEFELGVRRGKDLDHHGEEHEEFRRDWQWYLHDLYWRIFG